jgi:hypothetical protein
MFASHKFEDHIKESVPLSKKSIRLNQVNGTGKRGTKSLFFIPTINHEYSQICYLESLTNEVIFLTVRAARKYSEYVVYIRMI